MLENEVGVSNISRVVVTMQVPKASSLKVNGNNKAEQNDVPVTFKVKGDATSYYLSGDPDMLTGITSGLLANLSEPVNGVYTIPSFDLSTVDTNSKGKKTVYLMLENEVGVSRVIKVSVKMLQ